ncbi:bifunctional nuclease family protein [Fundidesulfovibrio butyratiphilus]
MIEMKVYGLALDEESQAPVLILKDQEDKVTLPIWIGAMEAMAISLTLNGVRLPRPMTHDLLLSSLTMLGAQVRRAEVVDLRDNTFYARVVLEQDGKIIDIDARPSDAVALALRAEAPVFVDSKVLSGAAAQKAKPVFTEGDGEKWSDILDNLNPDDSKYKM